MPFTVTSAELAMAKPYPSAVLDAEMFVKVAPSTPFRSMALLPPFVASTSFKLTLETPEALTPKVPEPSSVKPAKLTLSAEMLMP